jgi:hypothetical protein
MKAYLITTGIVFGAITLIHVWRFMEEGQGLLTNYVWVVSTLVSVGLCAWACRLLWIGRFDGRSLPHR